MSELRTFSTITLDRLGDFFTLIDDEAAELASQYKWTLHHCGKGKYYARASWCKAEKRHVRLYLHRLIAAHYLAAPLNAEATVVDHINGNGLDNRAANLRWLTPYANRWGHARHGRSDPINPAVPL